MLEFHINPSEGKLRLEPSGPMQSADFEALAAEETCR